MLYFLGFGHERGKFAICELNAISEFIDKLAEHDFYGHRDIVDHSFGGHLAIRLQNELHFLCDMILDGLLLVHLENSLHCK